MSKPKSIMHPKVLLVEGMDAKMFCIWALQAYKLEDIEVHDFGGITNLNGYMQTIKNLTGFDMVHTLGVIRDSEMDSEGAVRSIKRAFRDADLKVPSAALQWASDSEIKTGFMLLPGDDSLCDEVGKGALEHLCLGAISNKALLECVDEFTDIVKTRDIPLSHEHKTRLHSYLAITPYVGMKIGEAAKAGAWDWEHVALRDFRTFLESM